MGLKVTPIEPEPVEVVEPGITIDIEEDNTEDIVAFSASDSD